MKAKILIVGKFWIERTEELIESAKVPAARMVVGLLSLSKMKENVPEL